MKDIEDKNKELSKLSNENTNKVCGGYKGKDCFGTESIRCDNCFSQGAIPVNGGHICLECIKKLKEILGVDNAAKFFGK